MATIPQPKPDMVETQNDLISVDVLSNLFERYSAEVGQAKTDEVWQEMVPRFEEGILAHMNVIQEQQLIERRIAWVAHITGALLVSVIAIGLAYISLILDAAKTGRLPYVFLAVSFLLTLVVFRRSVEIKAILRSTGELTEPETGPALGWVKSQVFAVLIAGVVAILGVIVVPVVPLVRDTVLLSVFTGIVVKTIADFSRLHRVGWRHWFPSAMSLCAGMMLVFEVVTICSLALSKR